jgi:hypothetical protein
MKQENRLTNEQIKARLILVVGVGLTLSFMFSVFAMLFGILFVVQPTEMSELDAQQVNILSSMLLTLSGGLIGLLASNGLKDRPKDPPTTPPVP